MVLKKTSVQCPLCKANADWFCSYFIQPVNFYRCGVCKSIFKNKQDFIEVSAEKKRYETHNNDVKDKRYQEFVSPITSSILGDFSPEAIGLDYGCGTGPVATYVLKKNDYNVILYDPFFYPDKDYQKRQYDFIICCEVMEHFHHPKWEFNHLRRLLKDGGKLYCKTKMISNDMNADTFKVWHYKNDPTHVFFYSPSALKHIAVKEEFRSVSFDDKLIIFST